MIYHANLRRNALEWRMLVFGSSQIVSAVKLFPRSKLWYILKESPTHWSHWWIMSCWWWGRERILEAQKSFWGQSICYSLSFLIPHLSLSLLWPSGSLFHLYKIIPWWIGFGTQPKSSHQINFVAWIRKCDRSWTITKNFY